MDAQERRRLSIDKVVEKAVDDVDASGSRFDKLVALRDEVVRMLNAERETEKKRLADRKAKLKEELKAESDKLRSVSVITKPRGPKKAAVEAAVSVK